MSHSDDYDAFYSPIDPRQLVDIEAAVIAAYALRQTKSPSPEPSKSLKTRLEPPSPDEFDSYDFSEFTAQDFENIDAFVLAHTPEMSTPPATPTPVCGTSRDGGIGTPNSSRSNNGNGGPQIEIALERAARTDAKRLVKGRKAKIHKKLTPFEQFRRWKRVLSVTDLVGPSWCEVQFDYGLRQKRYKKLEARPSSFVTAEGKTITVVQAVAAQNDRTVTRGKSVHKVLEREVQPEAVSVDVTTQEERWGLRIINMLVSLGTLTESGICREMPVFGIVHDQVVTGIIDEVVRRPFQPEIIGPQRQTRSTSSPNKREASSTPSKPSAKKHKHSTTDEQPRITAFFIPGKNAETPDEPPRRYSLHLSDTKTRTRPSLPPDEDSFASRLQLMLYHRLLSNLLSTAQSIPAPQSLDFAVLWRRVGVNPALKFSDNFLTQAGLSASFEVNDSGTVHSLSHLTGLACLNDLTSAWVHAVKALNVATVNNTLILTYRMQPIKKPTKTLYKGVPGIDLPTEKAQDAAATIQTSTREVLGEPGGDDELARAIFESLKDSLATSKAEGGDPAILGHPFGLAMSEAPGYGKLEGEAPLMHDPQLAWVLQQSLLPRVQETYVPKESPSHEAIASTQAPKSAGDPESDAKMQSSSHEPVQEVGPLNDGTKTAPNSPGRSDELAEADETMTVSELNIEARILGTKEFQLDDALLDGYLTHVLGWWHGRRAPEGVNVELTRRCMSCEYREGCEWRERKAREATDMYANDSSPANDEIVAE
ncbi:exonuclease V [Trametes meyenii]|nr:exonuclease V [Trametes meyenii]